MAEQITRAGGHESLSQQQYNLTDTKRDAAATVASVYNDEGDAADSRGWNEGDPEMTEPRDPRPEYDQLKTGETAPPDLIGFVKLKEFEKFYTYVDDKQAEVKRRFFDNGRLWARRWDFFYIYPSPDIQATHILLLPISQAKHFLRTINKHLNTNLALPSQAEAPGLIMYAPNNGTPRPRYIAWAADPLDAPSVKGAVPGRSYLPENERHGYDGYKDPTEKDMMNFLMQMEALAETERQRKERQKLKREKARHLQQKAKAREMMRAQRYLGLRKRRENAGDESQEHGLSSRGEKSGLALDLAKPAPYPQEGSVIFICIDVEAYEFSPNPITEIGVATLDTADIAGVAPGENGRNWFKKIRARHFLVKEFRHLENSHHCQGNRDGFVFGVTEVIALEDAKIKILGCFKAPFSKPFSKGDEDYDALIELGDDLEADRNIVFVGHDVKQDIDYIKRLKVDLSEVSQIKDVIDSANMYHALRRDTKGSLGSALLHFGLVGCNLHNGGNDAVYTLQAMIATAIKAEVEKETLWEQHVAELDKRTKEEVGHQIQATRKQKEGWELGEDSDGGDPEDPFDQFKPKVPSQQPPTPRIIDPVKGSWTGDFSRNATNSGPSITYRPTQQAKGNVLNLNSWRPGINEMRDEDIERPL